MPRIYLLSRPDAANDLTDLVAELLRECYGAKNVIRGGFWRNTADYARQTALDIRACDVVLLVLEPHWLTATDKVGQRWLAQENDPIRIALDLALRMQKLIAPVLSDNAEAATSSELPADLQPLTRYQAFRVRPAPFFENDLSALIQQINTKLTWKPASIPLLALASVTLVIACAAALIAFTYTNSSDFENAAIAIGAFTEVILFPTMCAAGIVLAARRTSWRWLCILIGMGALTLIASVSLTIVGSISQLDVTAAIFLVASLIEPILCALVFLIFALFGPRRETAFA